MALIRKLAVYGQLHPNASRAEDDSFSDSSDRKETFLKYDDKTCYDVCTSSNLVDFLRGRELGNQKVQPMLLNLEYGTRHLLQKNILREYEIPLRYLNKVFCSQWLTGQQVIFGTKCNKLIVLDLVTSQLVLIPSLESSEHSIPPEIPCGIHSIQLNPSRTLLATGAQNPNDVAVYRLPTMDPVCVGEGAHRDWVFDIVWLDDQFFVSGSRDTTLALWRVNDDVTSSPGDVPSYHMMRPLVVRQCRLAQKVRALTFNTRCQEVVALSLNAYLHLYDVETFRQKLSYKLPHCQENVCLTSQQEHSLYAVGSKSYVTLIDTRTLYPIKNIPSNFDSCSVRSTSFAGNILTIGTGIGRIMFYDIRADKYLDFSRTGRSTKQTTLKTTKGWVYRDEIFRDVLQGNEYTPAIYTHCYDPSGTKLFAAGGPLPASLYGNYAGLWQ